MEEYACAAQVWNLNHVDLAEITRNSKTQCCFEDCLKNQWLGKNWNGDLKNPLDNNGNFYNQIRKILVYLKLDTVLDI